MKNLNRGLGIWQIINSTIITDIIAKAGFDLTILDLEHGLHTPNSIQDAVFTAKSNSLYTVVRIPCVNYQYLVQVIDTGVDAILFPHIESTDQLKNILEQSLLFPTGNKSYSPFIPKYNYGQFGQGFQKDPSIGILIESILGINNAENLLKEESIDFVYFGAYDLSVEINKPGQIFAEDIIDYLKKLLIQTKKNNKKILSIYRNKEELDILSALGVDFPISSVDTSHLISKLKEESEYFNKINS